MPTADNTEADANTRPGARDIFVHLSPAVSVDLWVYFGGSLFDVMASSVSAQRVRDVHPRAGTLRPFLSRCDCQDAASMDVLMSNAGGLPGATRRGLACCFPPTDMVEVSVQYLAESRAWVVLLAPGIEGPCSSHAAGETTFVLVSATGGADCVAGSLAYSPFAG